MVGLSRSFGLVATLIAVACAQTPKSTTAALGPTPPSSLRAADDDLCVSPFSDAWHYTGSTDAERDEVRAWAWLDNTAREHVLVAPDDPDADAARCYASGPHRDLNFANWCCRPSSGS